MRGGPVSVPVAQVAPWTDSRLAFAPLYAHHAALLVRLINLLFSQGRVQMITWARVTHGLMERFRSASNGEAINSFD